MHTSIIKNNCNCNPCNPQYVPINQSFPCPQKCGEDLKIQPWWTVDTSAYDTSTPSQAYPYKEFEDACYRVDRIAKNKVNITDKKTGNVTVKTFIPPTGGQTTIVGADVTTASNKVTLGGTPVAAALKAFSVDVNETNLNLANLGGILPITKGGTGLSTVGTPGQQLVVNAAGTALAFATPSAGGTVVLSGDVTGPSTATIVGKFANVNVPNAAGTAGQVLSLTSPTQAVWATPAADTYNNGITKTGTGDVRLGGNLIQPTEIQVTNVNFLRLNGLITNENNTVLLTQDGLGTIQRTTLNKGVVNVANFAALPALGNNSTIYLTEDTDQAYKYDNTTSSYKLIGGLSNYLQFGTSGNTVTQVGSNTGTEEIITTNHTIVNAIITITNGTFPNTATTLKIKSNSPTTDYITIIVPADATVGTAPTSVTINTPLVVATTGTPNTLLVDSSAVVSATYIITLTTQS